jgi:FkbM family methyltransferase
LSALNGPTFCIPREAFEALRGRKFAQAQDSSLALQSQMRSKIKTFLQSTPDLLVLLKPLAFAFRVLINGPTPQSCVACFSAITSISRETLDGILSALNEQEHVFFVQIGSNDGKMDDPLYKYVSKTEKWKGILVEPVGHLHSRLKENYCHRKSLVFEKALVSDKRRQRVFYFVSEEAKERLVDLPFWYQGLGSFDINHILGPLGDRVRPYIVSETIEAITLQELFKRNSITKLDLVHIDTEGHDYRIFKQLDLRSNRPKVVIVEFKHLGYWECYRLIRRLRKYYDVFSSGADLVAVQRDDQLRLDRK